MAKPTIVIIHGGWHKPSAYNKLTNELRKSGCEIHVPALPSMNGSRPPNADLATDTALIRSFITDLVSAGQIVILLMHSYGGQVGTNALTGLSVTDRAQQGLTGGVAHLIYMTASALIEGVSMMDLVQAFGHDHLVPLAFDFAEDDTCISRDPKTLLIGPGLLDVEVDEYVAGLARWNGKTMYQALDKCAWKEENLSVSYIITTNDMTLPVDYQKHMIEEMRTYGKTVDIVELETGHCPNITMPKEIANFVNGAVAKIEAKV